MYWSKKFLLAISLPCIVIATVLFTILLASLAKVSNPVGTGSAVGLVAGIIFVGLLLPYSSISVDAYKAKVTKDYFTGKLYAYTDKFSLRWPWEIQQGDEIILEREFVVSSGDPTVEEMGTDDHQAVDGPTMSIGWAIPTRVDKERVLTFIQNDPKTWKVILHGMIGKLVGDVIGNEQSENVLKKRKEISDKITRAFEGDKRNYFEEIYGLKVGPIEIRKATQDATSAQGRAEIARAQNRAEAIKELIDGGVPAEEAVRAVQLMFGEIAPLIHEGLPPNLSVYAPGASGFMAGSVGRVKSGNQRT
ncbi:MAG: hypothetical protein HQ402_03465 [Parcubacteria group bacterium]|nr:hypothetical protein [Parcubacteria group bacterium]